MAASIYLESMNDRGYYVFECMNIVYIASGVGLSSWAQNVCQKYTLQGTLVNETNTITTKGVWTIYKNIFKDKNNIQITW